MQKDILSRGRRPKMIEILYQCLVPLVCKFVGQSESVVNRPHILEVASSNLVPLICFCKFSCCFTSPNIV